MNKLSLFSAVALILIFMPLLFSPALVFADPYIEVVPLQHDFGDVEVGDYSHTIITIMNINGHDLVIYDFRMQGSADFSITSAPTTPVIVMSGGLTEVEVTFSPSAAGYSSAVLEIESNDPTRPLVSVLFGGAGVASQPPPVTIEDILAFFDESVDAGTLEGRGHHPFVKNARLKVMRGILMLASRFIDRDKITQACRALIRAFRRCDGNPLPSDFVIGDAVVELANMIQELRTSFECGSCQPRPHKDVAFDNNVVSTPTEFSLEQNYPNPFNPITTIKYQILELSLVTIKVHDVLGNEIATLVNEEKPVGSYEVEFNAENFSSGVYIYQLKSGSYTENKKMLLLR
ncbi:MAG: choice-of-anchor D domain-containing protein [Ignavibacterium sp.]|nr:MAG: choice-of-anchor D domain-containing protein [Ignavibacterium sp.]